jgi:predicted O-methyltransferase YrrM
MRLIDRLYQQAANTPSDIWEHLPLLRQIAEQYRHITEFGTGYGVSTVALLAAKPDVFVTYDRVPQDRVKMLETAAKNLTNTRFEYRIADVREIEIEPTDFLFIDTWHVESQMNIELRLHANKVRSVIGFHDTETFGSVGESAGHRGISYAISRFLKEHPEWEIREHRANNNGLTLMGRGHSAPGYLTPKSSDDLVTHPIVQ